MCNSFEPSDGLIEMLEDLLDERDDRNRTYFNDRLSEICRLFSLGYAGIDDLNKKADVLFCHLEIESPVAERQEDEIREAIELLGSEITSTMKLKVIETLCKEYPALSRQRISKLVSERLKKKPGRKKGQRKGE